jgi:hypothetical protein
MTLVELGMLRIKDRLGLEVTGPLNPLQILLATCLGAEHALDEHRAPGWVSELLAGVREGIGQALATNALAPQPVGSKIIAAAVGPIEVKNLRLPR